MDDDRNDEEQGPKGEDELEPQELTEEELEGAAGGCYKGPLHP